MLATRDERMEGAKEVEKEKREKRDKSSLSPSMFQLH